MVNREDSFDSGIGQNLALVYNFENTLTSSPKVCLTEVSGYLFFMTDLFNSVRSVYILTLPGHLSTTSIGAHRSVGSATLAPLPLVNVGGRCTWALCFSFSTHGLLL